MRYCWLFFLVLISCGDDFDGSQIPFKKRATISNLNKVEMILGVKSSPYFPDEIPYIFLKEIESGQHFIPVDTSLLSPFLHDNLISNMRYPFGGSVKDFLSFYSRSLPGIKVLVSGNVKQPFSGDIRPALPLVLSKIDIIPTCSVPYSKTEKQVTLQNTTWYWRGFVNESNQVYSFPACENPNVSIMLTEKLIKDNYETTGYLYPDAMEFYLKGFFFLVLHGYVTPVYEIKDSKLELHTVRPTGILYYRDFPPGFPIYSTRFTAEKADSLTRMILPYSFPEPSYIEFILDGNQLILYNPKLKIRALFTSD